MIIELLIFSYCISVVQNVPGSSFRRKPKFQQLIIFGDSLTDDGVEAQGLSHGFTRFSNGPVWPEYLNTMLETGGNYSNYAYSGAKSDNDNFYFTGWSGILWQINNYLESTMTIPSNSLIVLQLGGNNDMFNGDNKTVEVTENAKNAVMRLAQRGARKMLALNLADLSKAPGVPNAQAGQRMSTLVSEANTRLKVALDSSAVASFSRFSLLDLKLFDLNAATNQALASFSNTAEPYTHHRNNTRPDDIKNYAFFDEFHPSTFFHLKIAQAINEFVKNWN
uniref:SGNH hydrolase-type esterase domain-containing protein n=1 Tax=Plectus sambesii TaxID=2011161 RepID=A0A914WB34_9BILA